MDFISSLLSDFSPYMPLISMGLLMLAGLNMPISEDLVLIISGALSAAYLPDRALLVFAGCYTGALASDIISYCLGRFGGRFLMTWKHAHRMMPEEKIRRMEGYFEQYGGKTLLFGRFIPFGVRNLIFMTAGFSRMPFIKFVLIDIIPLSISSSLTFYLGMSFSDNYHVIIPWLDRFKLVIAGIAALIVAIILIMRHRKRNIGVLNAEPADHRRITR